MKLTAFLVFLYGLIVLIGGIIGFVKAGSMMSLITGGACGIILVASALGMFKNSVTGCFAAMLLATLLAVFFTYRFLITFAFMPAGLMALISIVVAARLFMMKKV